MVLFVSSSSSCLGWAAACDCGTPWAFLLHSFLHYHRRFRVKRLGKFNNFELLTFLATLLYRAGNVEKNPEPPTNTSNDTNQSFSFPRLQGNLSLMHYNVQSILHKTDILEPELINFDIIFLTETWLNDCLR